MTHDCDPKLTIKSDGIEYRLPGSAIIEALHAMDGDMLADAILAHQSMDKEDASDLCTDLVDAIEDAQAEVTRDRVDDARNDLENSDSYREPER